MHKGLIILPGQCNVVRLSLQFQWKYTLAKCRLRLTSRDYKCKIILHVWWKFPLSGPVCQDLVGSCPNVVPRMLSSAWDNNLLGPEHKINLLQKRFFGKINTSREQPSSACDEISSLMHERVKTIAEVQAFYVFPGSRKAYTNAAHPVSWACWMFESLPSRRTERTVINLSLWTRSRVRYLKQSNKARKEKILLRHSVHTSPEYRPELYYL